MVALLVIVGFPGCWKKSGMAEVLEKEHIAAREPSPTPTSPIPAQPSPAAEKPEASPTESPDDTERELAPDEIAVDGIVMKKDVRGTSRDPRAGNEEQWIVKLQLVSDLKRLTALTDRALGEAEGRRPRQGYLQTGQVYRLDLER